MISEQKISNPVLLDSVIQDIQEGLLIKLPWLNKAFGRAFKIEEPMANGKSKKFPATYSTASEYESVFPDDARGNYSFFEISDPVKIDYSLKLPIIKANGFLIFWFNTLSVYPDNNRLYIEDIKFDILKAISTIRLSPGNRIQVSNIYEKPENIFKGYDISQIDSQYLMQPYYGLKFEIELTTRALCYK